MYTVLNMPTKKNEDSYDWAENVSACFILTSMIVSLLVPLAMCTLGCKVTTESLETLFVRPMEFYDRFIEFVFSPLHTLCVKYVGLDISTTRLLTIALPKLTGHAILMPLLWPIIYGSDLGLIISTRSCYLNVCETCPETLSLPCYKIKLHYTEFLWWYMPLGFDRASYGFQGIRECDKKEVNLSTIK